MANSMERVALTVKEEGSSKSSQIGGVAEVFVDGGRAYRTTRAWFWDFVIQLCLGAAMIAFGVCFVVYFVRWDELKTDVAARTCPTLLDPSSATLDRDQTRLIAKLVNDTAPRQCDGGQSVCPSNTFGIYVAPAAWCHLSEDKTQDHLMNPTGRNILKVQTMMGTTSICTDDFKTDYSRKNSFYACLSPAQVHIVMMLSPNASSDCHLCNAPYEAPNVKHMADCVMKYTSEGIMVCAND